MISTVRNNKKDDDAKSQINGIKKKYNANIFNNKNNKKESKTEGRRRFTTVHPSFLNPSVIDQNDMQ